MNNNNDDSRNNGGETDYYAIKEEWKSFQDVIEDRQMNYAQGNILKVACTFNIGRHNGTTYERELNKIIYFANREKLRIKRDTKLSRQNEVMKCQLEKQEN